MSAAPPESAAGRTFRERRGAYSGAAILAAFYGAALAAHLAGLAAVEIGAGPLGAVPTAALLVVLAAWGILSILTLLFRGAERLAEPASLLLLGAVVLLAGWRLAAPFRLVLFGRLWPEAATDVEALAALTLFAVIWNGWYGRRRKAD